MSKLSDRIEYLDELWAAHNAPLGRVIVTDNPELVRQRFYQIRAANAPDFDAISVLRTADNRIWLLNREGKVESDDAQTE